MRTLLSLTLALLCGLSNAAADVYKGVDAAGRAVYSDAPLPGGTPIDVPANASPPPEAATENTDPAGADLGFRGSYDSFEIIAPADRAVVRNADRRVDVSLLLDPPLRPDHRLRLDVDGQPPQGDIGARTQLSLSDLALGSHRLQAFVLDAEGVPVAATAAISIHVREPLPAGTLP